MLNKLRSFALAALMLLPFATQAQETLTVADGTASNNFVPIYGNYMDDPIGTQSIYPADMLTDLVGTAISGLHWYIYTGSSSNWGSDKPIKVTFTIVEETSFSSSWLSVASGTTVYDGVVTSSDVTAAGGYSIELDAPYVYSGGNLMISIQANPNDLSGYGQTYWYGINQNVTNASRYGYGTNSYNFTSGGTNQSFLPKVTFTYEPLGGCKNVHDLVASNITSSGLTLTWADTNNTGATYTILNGEDTVAANISGNSYNVTGLQANTAYTLSVVSNCSDSEVSLGRKISIRTACAAASLPYFTSFEDADLPAGDNQLPWCWVRYNNGSNGTSIPYSYNSSYNANTGSRSLYFYFASNYGDTIMAILPEVDTAAFPMSGNQLRFMARSTSGSRTLMVGTLTDPTDPSTFVMDAEVAVSGSYAEYEALLGVNSNGAYPVIMINGQASSSATVYVDDLYIERQPTCMRVQNLTASSTSSTTLTVSWQDTLNTGAYYVIRRVNSGDTTYTTVQDTTYTFTGLTPASYHYIQVVAHCSDTDSSRAATLGSSVRVLYAGHEFGSFTATGTKKRGDLVYDTAARNITIPVYYTDNVGAYTTSEFNITFSVPSYASTWVDTTGDGSFTCQVYTSDIKNYLHVNVPLVVRVRAEDTALYSDYTVTLVGEECVANRNYVASAERIRYTYSWDNPDTLVSTNYFISSPTRLDAAALASAQYITLNDVHTYTVEGLARETKYYIYLKSVCDTVWHEDSVTTYGLGGQDAVTVAPGSTSTGYVPVYGYMYDNAQRSQSIYPASMLTGLIGKTITGFKYYPTSPLTAWWTGTYANVTLTVNLAVTEQENLSDGWDATTTTQVFQGQMTSDGAITFDQPFVYNGGNLLVDFEMPQRAAYSTRSFTAVSTSAAQSRYAYGTSYSTSSGNACYYLPQVDMIFEMPAIACPEVTNISIDTVSNTIANISWMAADADYCVGNQIIVSPAMLDETALETTAPVALAANAVSYNATGLIPDHDYYVYIKALCNGTEHPEGTSGWATATFRTFPNVRTPEIVWAEVTGKHSARVGVYNTGLDFGQPTNYSYLVSTTKLDATALAAATPTATGIDTMLVDIDNLASLTKYYLYFRNVMGNEVSPWSEPDSVSMPAQMPAVALIQTTNVRHNAMTALWMSDVDNFADETAWRAAIALHGQAPTAADWVTVTDTVSASYIGMHLFTGLLTDSAYDIYVCAFDQATGMTSDTLTLDSVRTATYPTGCETYGTGSTSTQYFFPGYYGWQYSAGLYPIESTGTIEAIAAQAFVNRADKNDSMFVWVKVVDADFAFDAATTTFNSMLDGATAIYADDSISVAINDWMSFQFPTPMSINAGEQLLVLVRGKAQATNGDGARTAYATNVSGKFWYIAKDNSDINPATATVSSPQGGSGSVTGARPNLNICFTPATCLAVSTLYALDITDSSANILWAPGDEESNWEYVLSTSDTLTATELEAAATAITVNNLAATGLVRDTNYFFYLRPVCSATDKGFWSRGSFRTLFVDYFYDVTVEATPANGGSATGAGHFLENSIDTLVATAAEGYHFVSWTSGTEVLGTSDSLFLTVVADIAVVANFAINTYEVTVTASPEEGGSVAGVPTAAVDHGTELTLTATAAEGYHFVNWTADAEVLGTETTLTLTVTADIAVVAHFEANPVEPATYTVTVLFDETLGSVSGIPAEPVVEGTELTLTATPSDAKYEFVAWIEGTDTLSHEASYTFTVTADITLTALFVDKSGISQVAMETFVVSTSNGLVRVSGAEGMDIRLFDVNGRLLGQRANAAEQVEFRVVHSGVYLVQVGSSAARRVVVTR